MPVLFFKLLCEFNVICLVVLMVLLAVADNGSFDRNMEEKKKEES